MAEVIAVEFGKGLAIEAAKSLMQLVTARPMEEMRLAWGFKDQLQKLMRKIVYIKAFLEDMGNAKREMNIQVVNHWLQNVKDMVYSAEDFMDEYAYEILRRQLESNGNASRRRFRTMFKRSNRIRFRILMTHKVGEILAKFDELIKEAKEFGIKPGVLVIDVYRSNSDDNMIEYASILMQVRKDAGLSADASEFIGRKLDQEKLLQMICSPANNNLGLSVMAIVGMGGLGKTTLARRLFNSNQVVGHFAKQFWICVGENFDITRLLKEMVAGKCDLDNTDAIIKQLKAEVKNSKYLLVLDDVWNEYADLWDSLKHSLQRIGSSPGSVILVTTRSTEVAVEAGVDQPHLLTELSEEESWALFKQQFVMTREALLNVSCFEGVGRRIVLK